ncbi:hypothetical protein V6N11_074237 [Hibiscus sabdariffa]|uniref:Uncharacterized protein n=1 Tax=Hibiscus sabdariffa TaxID=183260 RepID=A0ABR2NJJ5_9ROSI
MPARLHTSRVVLASAAIASSYDRSGVESFLTLAFVGDTMELGTFSIDFPNLDLFGMLFLDDLACSLSNLGLDRLVFQTLMFFMPLDLMENKPVSLSRVNARGLLDPDESLEVSRSHRIRTSIKLSLSFGISMGRPCLM